VPRPMIASGYFKRRSRHRNDGVASDAFVKLDDGKVTEQSPP
jgi:hypothetical protein